MTRTDQRIAKLTALVRCLGGCRRLIRPNLDAYHGVCPVCWGGKA